MSARVVLLLSLIAGTLAIVHRAQHVESPSSSSLVYQTRWYEQTLDHFNFQEDRTFNERYLYSDQYWGTKPISASCKGPILFYTGNEGDMYATDVTLTFSSSSDVWFFNNTGFVTDTLSQQLGGLVIFAEHRYYGESMPFGNGSFEPNNVGFFTTEQALADYAELLTSLKSENSSLASCPVIAFGGSYGGMLAGWFRLKYPNVVAGAIAASAPVLQFYTTGVSQWVYAQITTRTFGSANTQCPAYVLKASQQIQSMGNSASGLSQLTKIFSLCSPLKDYNDLYQWISSALQYMAMGDYPYPASFLGPMPGNPVTVFCDQFINLIQNGVMPVDALAPAIGVYYNWTGQAGSCYDFNTSGPTNLGAEGWDYQACTEMVMPISFNGTSDETAWCQFQYKATPRPLWVPTYYGANATQLAGGSNIFWSNGNLDPWSGGGVLTAPNDLQTVYLIEGGAHHLDLRTPNPLDPPSVVVARQMEVASIQQWITEWVTLRGEKRLPY